MKTISNLIELSPSELTEIDGGGGEWIFATGCGLFQICFYLGYNS